MWVWPIIPSENTFTYPRNSAGSSTICPRSLKLKKWSASRGEREQLSSRVDELYGGTAFCPNRVLHQTELVQNLRSLGYQVVDVWTNPGMPLRNRTRKAIRSVPFPGCISGYNHRIKTKRSCRDKGKRDVTRNAVHTLSRRLPGSVRFTPPRNL